jgi:hypothetical protein
VTGAVEVAEQGDLGTVVQDLLVDPPDDVDEYFFGVAAVGVGAVADGVERGVIAVRQRAAPFLDGPGEGGDRAVRVSAYHVAVLGEGPAARRVVGAQRQHLAEVAEPPGDRRERRR